MNSARREHSSILLPRRLVAFVGAMALLVAPLLHPTSANAQVDSGFFPVASGIVELGADTPEWHVAELDLPEGEAFSDPAAGTPGFLLVAEGVVLIENDLTGHRTFVQTAGALFLAAEDLATLTAIGDDAVAWRFAVVPVGAGPPLARGDGVSRPLAVEGRGDDSAPGGAVRGVELRVGAILDGEETQVGNDDATVPLACAIANRVTPGDGDSIREGRCRATPDPGAEGQVRLLADDGDAVIAVLVVGPAIDPADLEPAARDDDGVPTPAASTSGGSGSSSSGNTAPAPSPTPVPDLTDLDSDSDGLNDQFELDNGTDPNNPDSDGDGLTDRQELIELNLNTDPNNPDTDGDGNSDGFEVNGGSGFVTRPDMVDTDGDGAGDGGEFTAGLNPTNPDTDGDGMLDADDFAKCDAFIPDTDGDGWLDGQEVARGTDCQEIDPFP